jgi:hypothetical protein
MRSTRNFYIIIIVSPEGDAMSERIAASLGATRPAGTSLFVLFVPSVDRYGEPIDHDYWVDQALHTFATLFRGATAYPRGRGRWRDDERAGALVADEPTVVTCYAAPQDITDEALARLRTFLHRLGREAQQGEVGIVFDGQYYGITEYDEGS